MRAQENRDFEESSTGLPGWITNGDGYVINVDAGPSELLL